MSEQVLIAGVVVVAMVIYSLSGGADYGGGVWDLLARGSRARAQRELIASAIAPIWEANHVWLILVIVLLFVCFPAVYATIGTALHVPLTLMLVGIVLRGSAFVFRSHEYGLLRPPGVQGTVRVDAARGWDLVFAVASLVTPVTLGMCVGAVASGTIRVDPDGFVRTDFVSSWLAPFPFAVGLFTLALFAYLGATYLTVEAPDPRLREDFRVRALGAAAATAVLGLVVLVLARSGAPVVYAALLGNPVLLGSAGIVAIGASAALWLRRYRLARPLAMVEVTLVVAGWGWAQYPYLVVPDLTIEGAHAPVAVLRMTLGILAVGSVLLVPAFLLLYGLFKGRMPAG